MKTIPSDALLPSEYQKLAERTEADPAKLLQLTSVKVVRLLHAGAGLATEAGEFWDIVKRHVFYGQPLDEAHLAEELGDLLWYVALACNALDKDLGAVMAANIRKLQARFLEKFDAEQAANRDLEAEQAALASEHVRCFEYDEGKETFSLEPAPLCHVNFEGKVCEQCGQPATRATHDLAPDGKTTTHWFCYKHARKAVQVGNFS